MPQNSMRLSRAIEDIAAVLQEVSRIETSEEINEEAAAMQCERVRILTEALEKINSPRTKNVSACKSIAAKALLESSGIFLGGDYL